MDDPIFPDLIRGVGTPLISKAGGICPLFLGGRAYDMSMFYALRLLLPPAPHSPALFGP